MIGFDTPLSPEKVEFAGLARQLLDEGVELLRDKQFRTEGLAIVGGVAYECGRIARANADRRTAFAVGENLMTNLCPDITQAFASLFMRGVRQEERFHDYVQEGVN